MFCFDDNFEQLELLTNKNILLYGENQHIEKINSLFNAQKFVVYGYCNESDLKSENLKELQFISFEYFKLQLKTNQIENLVVVLAYSPYMNCYQDKIKNTKNKFSELGVDLFYEGRTITAELNLATISTRIGLTSSKAKSNLKTFNDNLTDDISKSILEVRLQQNYLPNPENLMKLMAVSSDKIQYVASYLDRFNVVTVSKENPIIFYGVGQFATRHFEHIEKALKHRFSDLSDLNIFFCDKNADTLQHFNGYEIISPGRLISDFKSSTVAIMTERYALEIADYLITNGFERKQLKYLAFIDEEEQYFDKSLIHSSTPEVFVDVGVLDALTSIKFAEKYPYDKIYLFEPSTIAIKTAKMNLKNANISRYEFFPVGLWDSKTVLNFSGSDGNFGISDTSLNDCTLISVDTLDELLNSKYISFLKMDIEGAELNALKGAENTIKQYKPKLAISVYHKPEDLLEIPQFLKSIVPEYKFYLRHYSTGWHETVLYAIL